MGLRNNWILTQLALAAQLPACVDTPLAPKRVRKAKFWNSKQLDFYPVGCRRPASSPHWTPLLAPKWARKVRFWTSKQLEFLPSWLSPSSLQLALTPPFAPKWVRKGRFWTPRQLDFYPVWLSPSNLQPALASLSPLCGRGGWRLDGLMQARCSPNWPSTQALPCILLLLHV